MASLIKPRRGTSAPTTGTINQHELAVDTTNKRIYIGAADGSGTLIGSAPGGSDTQVQFNDGGVLAGDAGLTYNKTTDTLTVGSLVSTSGISVNGVIVFTFEGFTADDYETQMLVADPTQDNFIYFPNSSGYVALVPGSDTQVMFNDGGTTLGGDSGFTYNKSTDTLTLGGDIAVNGGDLTTTAGTASVFNTNATTLNVGGAASSTINIGATDGTSTIDLNSNLLKEVEFRNYFETKGTPVYTGGKVQDLAVDLSAGNVFVYTTAGSISSITVNNVPSKANTSVGFTLVLTCGNSLYDVAFENIVSATTKWPGGTSPSPTTTVGNTDIVSYVTYDGGSTWYGFAGGLNFS